MCLSTTRSKIVQYTVCECSANPKYDTAGSISPTLSPRIMEKRRCNDLRGYSLFKKPIADGTKDNLYVLMLLLGRLNLRPDWSIWDSTCKGCWGAKTAVCAFEVTFTSYRAWRHQWSRGTAWLTQDYIFLRLTLPNQQITEKERTDSIKEDFHQYHIHIWTLQRPNKELYIRFKLLI